MVKELTRTYKDLDLDFKAHPITKDVSKKVGTAAINRSIRNLIFTNFYDKPFRPSVGSGAQKLLFENINPLTANFLRDQIINVIQNYEPRAKIKNVIVMSEPDQNGYNARIEYYELNQTSPSVLTVILEIIR